MQGLEYRRPRLRLIGPRGTIYSRTIGTRILHSYKEIDILFLFCVLCEANHAYSHVDLDDITACCILAWPEHV